MILGAKERFCRFLAEEDDLQAKQHCYAVILCLPKAEIPTHALTCKTLLLWNENAGEALSSIRAERVVSRGFSSCCTLTLSSMKGRAVLSIQRDLPRLDGSIIAPQDIPLPEMWRTLSKDERIMLAGLRLIQGTGILF